MARVEEVSRGERVVMFDLDGGVADLSAFAHLLTVGDSGRSHRQAWQQFFAHLGQAAVVEPDRDVVEAVAGLVSWWCNRRPGRSPMRGRPGCD